MKPAWSRSKSEEVIGALWLIVCLLAHHEGFTVLMWLSGIQGTLSTIAAIVLAGTDKRKEEP